MKRPSETCTPLLSSSTTTRSTLLQRASLLSRLSFQWASYLVDITKSRPLQVADVWQLDPQDRSTTTYTTLMIHLKRPRDFVAMTLWLHWRELVTSALLSLVGATADALGPLLVFTVMRAVANQDQSIWYKLGTLIVYHVVKVVGKLSALHSTYVRSTVATRMLGALETLTFDITISSMRPADVTVAQASTRFFELTDIYEFVLAMHGVWTCPLGLVANLVMLYYIMGDAVVGIFLAAAALLILALVFKRLQKQIATHFLRYQEKRLEILSECFKTIQSIKLQALERDFLSRINDQRRAERAIARTMQIVEAIWRSLLTGLPEFVLASSFAVLVSTHSDYTISPSVVFASLLILYRVKELIGEMQMNFALLAAAGVALRHMLEFLESADERARQLEDQLHNDASLASSPSPTPSKAIQIQNAAIGRTNEPKIVMVNLTVPVGSFTVIYGQVGAGKSSLLEALVDRALVINSLNGKIHVEGRVAYCPQHPWLQSLSIRENILFGLPYDEHKYVNVLHACCLLRDLEALRYGDDTLVGPKGMALSTGQKARIALARACYADADVYLLDSTLTSVDAIVQSDIFQRCFIDLLRWKTIVLITHNAEIIQSPYVDQVVLIKDHRVIQERASKRKPSSNRAFLTIAPHRKLSFTPSQAHPPGASSLLPVSLKLMEIKSTRIELKWRHIEQRMTQRKGLPSKSCDNEIDSYTALRTIMLSYVVGQSTFWCRSLCCSPLHGEH